MNWFQGIIDFLSRFWPCEIVMWYERGVPYFCGVLLQKESWWCYGGELKPRLYFKIPWFMEIHTVAIKPDTIKLWNQNVTTTDNVSLRVRSTIRFEVVDAIAAWNEVQEYKDSLANECRAHLADAMQDTTYPELLANRKQVGREAKNAVNRVVKDWGLKVISVNLTDFTKTRDISLANV